MKKLIKIIAVMVAVLLTVGLLVVANGFVGNPISKLIVTHEAKEYLEETYPDTDYYIDSVAYSFKTGGYYAHVKSHSSEDTYFSVDYSLFGEMKYDNFTSRVTDGFNTWNRINHEYNEITDNILKQLPYELDMAYGAIKMYHKGEGRLDFGLDIANLELDKQYNLTELGKSYGKVTLYVYDEEVTSEKASEILLAVKNLFNEANQSFYAIDLVLRLPQNEEIKDWQDENTIRIEEILSKNLVEGRVLEEVERVILETETYYHEMDDAKQQEQMQG